MLSPMSYTLYETNILCVPAQTISAISSVLSSSLFDSPDSWTPSVLYAMLQTEQKQLDVPRKLFMTTIRHALTGMKASPF